MAKVGTSNQDRTISLKAAVRSCTNKQTKQEYIHSEYVIFIDFFVARMVMRTRLNFTLARTLSMCLLLPVTVIYGYSFLLYRKYVCVEQVV